MAMMTVEIKPMRTSCSVWISNVLSISELISNFHMQQFTDFSRIFSKIGAVMRENIRRELVPALFLSVFFAFRNNWTLIFKRWLARVTVSPNWVKKVHLWFRDQLLVTCRVGTSSRRVVDTNNKKILVCDVHPVDAYPRRGNVMVITTALTVGMRRIRIARIPVENVFALENIYSKWVPSSFLLQEFSVMETSFRQVLIATANIRLWARTSPHHHRWCSIILWYCYSNSFLF